MLLTAWSAGRPGRRSWPALTVAAAALVTGALVLALPGAWAPPGPVAGALLVVGGVAIALRCRQLRQRVGTPS